MTTEALESMVRGAIAASQADETFIRCIDGTTTSIPYAASTAIQAVAISGVTFQVSARFGNRFASAAGNVDSPTSIRDTVMRLEAIAKSLPSPDTIPPCPPSFAFKPSDMRHPLPESVPEWMAESMREVLGVATKSRLLASGAVSLQEQTTLLASSKGLFVSQPATHAALAVQMMNAKGTSSGFVSDRSTRFGDIRAKQSARRAADKCLAWKNPREEKFDRLTTVFEAPAFADLLLPFITQFDYDAIDQNRSFLRKLDGSTRIGSVMFADDVNLSSDPYNADVPAIPFSPDGAEITPRAWIAKGRIERAIKSPYYVAKHLGGDIDPFPSNLLVEGGRKSLDQLIAETDRGLLVTGFSGVAVEDPTNCLINASTQGGTFMILNGRIRHAVKNVILRETPVYLFLRKEAMGRAQRCSPRGSDFPMMVPPVRVKDVLYAGLSGMV